MLAGLVARVAAAMQISRSVIIPITRRSSLTTGTVPQSPSHMIFAAAARSVSGLHDFTVGVNTSWIVITFAPFGQAVLAWLRFCWAARHVPCESDSLGRAGR